MSEKYHVLALGGIGMSAIARLLKQKGYAVSGYDDNLSDLTCTLNAEGIEVTDTFPSSTKCLIYSSAIALDHPEIIRAKLEKIELMHRSEILSKLMQDKDVILVAGSHGKTTVSSILSHALVTAKLAPSFAVGGILNNYETNASFKEGRLFVAEADESDGSFLKLPCKSAIVTSLDNDHLDYWKNKENLHIAFRKFLRKPSGSLIWCCDSENLRKLCPKGISYGFSKDADLNVYNLKTLKAGSTFSFRYLNKTYDNVFVPLFGKHQILNAAAVITFFLATKLELQVLFNSFKTFSGVKRRQEFIGSHNYVDIYNDYAHHPTEIKAILDSFRQKIEERRLVVVFQPHRYSRIVSLNEDFKACFLEADILYVTEIYSASEEPIRGCFEKFFQSIDHPNKHLITSGSLCETLLKDVSMHDCVLFLGAGDINQKGYDFFSRYKNTKQKLKVGVLFGGVASEHEISLKTANFFFDNIDQDYYEVEPCFIDKDFKIDLNLLSKIMSFDVCIPALHGKKGEDGVIQSILEGLKIPFTGCNSHASSVCMNKAWTKAICESVKIPVAKYLHIALRDWKFEKEAIIFRLNNSFKTPLYIKGCHMGSTIGMTRCENFSSLENDINYVFSFDDELVVEEEVIGRQIEFAVWGNDFVHVGEPAEIICKGIYTYEKKYEDSLAKIPVDADYRLLEKGKMTAINVYKACGCRGLARIDFFLDQQDNFILNEINPIPGLTKTSPYYPMLKYQKISEKEFINKLIILAFHSHRSYV